MIPGRLRARPIEEVEWTCPLDNSKHKTHNSASITIRFVVRKRAAEHFLRTHEGLTPYERSRMADELVSRLRL
jgi:hypothetical protein